MRVSWTSAKDKQLSQLRVYTCVFDKTNSNMGGGNSEIKAIQVAKEAFIRGYYPRRPVIPDKHFSLIKRGKKTGRSKHFRAARQTNASFRGQK